MWRGRGRGTNQAASFTSFSSPHPLPSKAEGQGEEGEQERGREQRERTSEHSPMAEKRQKKSFEGEDERDPSDHVREEPSFSASSLNAIRVPYRRGNFRYLDTEVRPWGVTEGGAWRRARWALHLSRFDRSPTIMGPAGPASIANCQGVGYRTVVASDGLPCGSPFLTSSRRAWYWETCWRGAHLRLGVALPDAALHGPLGVDIHGWAICSQDGGTFHAGVRNGGREPFTEHDIIGCLLVGGTEAIPSTLLPQDGNQRQGQRRRRRKLVNYYGIYLEERIDKYDGSSETSSSREDQGIATNHNGLSSSSSRSCSFLKIYKNGRQIQEMVLSPLEPYYYPAFSLYPGTSIEVNWGPTFMYPPPPPQQSSYGLPHPCPSAEVQREMLIGENLFDLSLYATGNLHEKARENDKS